MLSLKYFIARLISASWIGGLIGMAYGQKIKWNDLRINVGSPLIVGKIKAYLFWGMYESSEARMIKKYLPGNDLPVLELGASIGAVSSLINRHKKKGIKSVHVEAYSKLIPLIERNLLENNATDYTVDQSIIGKQGFSFQIGSDNTVGKLVKDPNSKASDCTPLHALINKYAFGSFFLISDIEGAEAFFLIDDDISLKHCKGMIIELHDIEIAEKMFRIADLKKAIVNLGFKIMEENGPNIYAVK